MQQFQSPSSSPLWRPSAWPRRKITKKRVDHDKRASQGNAGRTGWMMMSSPEQREENIKVSFWSQEPPTAHKQRNGSQLPCSAASAGQHAGRGRTAGVRPPTPDSSKERAPESIGRAHRGAEEHENPSSRLHFWPENRAPARSKGPMEVSHGVCGWLSGWGGPNR